MPTTLDIQRQGTVEASSVLSSQAWGTCFLYYVSFHREKHHVSFIISTQIFLPVILYNIFELALQEARRLKEHVDQQQALLSARQPGEVKVQVMEAMGQIDIQKVEMHTLIQKLEQTEDLKETTKKRNTALDLSQQRHAKSLSTEAHRRNKKETEVVDIVVNGLSKTI